MIHTVASTGRRLRALSTAAVLVATTLASSAACAADPGWYVNREIKKIVVTSQGGFNVFVSPPLSGCVSQSGYGDQWASVYPSHVGINRLMALMLTTKTAGKKIDLYFNDTKCTVEEARTSDE